MRQMTRFLPSNPFSITYDAILRPSRCALFFKGGRRNLLAATIATCLVVGAMLAGIGLLLPQIIPIKRTTLLYALLLSPVCSILPIGLLIQGSLSELSVPENMLFWFLRCQLIITPPFALVLSLSEHDTIAPWLVVTFLVLAGMWIGDAITVKLLSTSYRKESSAARWILAGGAVMTGGMLWYASRTNDNPFLLIALVLLGIAIGLVQPHMLWEVPLSVMLLLATRAGYPPLRVRPLHPATLDELCLCPLPGLRATLVQACKADIETGSDWLLDVAQHPGLHNTAVAALHHLVQQSPVAHPLLFWLSTHEQGQVWLRTLYEQAKMHAPLMSAYVALMDTTDMGAWATAIQEHRRVFEEQRHLPGGSAMLSLLNMGTAVLEASRWNDAVERMRLVAEPDGVERDDLWQIVVTLQSRVRSIQPDLLSERLHHGRVLLDNMDDLDGWPSVLLEAVSEHLAFLLRIEQHRGAWLL